jgi:glutamyl-tRNA synthetase
MRNYLMLLGWSPSGDREIVPWSVIEDEFRLEDVNPVARLLRREEVARVQR